jgi:hypothetical protein
MAIACHAVRISGRHFGQPCFQKTTTPSAKRRMTVTSLKAETGGELYCRSDTEAKFPTSLPIHCSVPRLEFRLSASLADLFLEEVRALSETDYREHGRVHSWQRRRGEYGNRCLPRPDLAVMIHVQHVDAPPGNERVDAARADRIDNARLDIGLRRGTAVHASLPPPTSPAQRIIEPTVLHEHRNRPIVLIRDADRAAPDDRPLRAMHLRVAPLPRLMTEPTGISKGTSLVVAAAVFQPVTHVEVFVEPL